MKNAFFQLIRSSGLNGFFSMTLDAFFHKMVLIEIEFGVYTVQ